MCHISNPVEVWARLWKHTSSRETEQGERTTALAECRAQVPAITEAELAQQHEKKNFSRAQGRPAARRN
jgi:hypothetical protein